MLVPIPTPAQPPARGGRRNVRTPLRNPCDRLLDIQANRQELQRDLANVEALIGDVALILQILDRLYALAALIEPVAQMRLEAERARMEASHG